MSGDTKTSVWAPAHDGSEDMDLDGDRPSGIPPPAYQEEYTTPEPSVPSGPSWKQLHSAPRENFKNSPFLRMPEPLIAKIMTDYCGKEDILRLRHTSRTFMRIFSEKHDFQPLWLAGDDDEDLSHVWTAPNCTYPEQTPKLCSSCFEINRDRDPEVPDSDDHQLWCRACKDFHSELHFSHLQRGELERERTCIGREGHVRLCSHYSLSWGQVRGLAKQVKKGIACVHDGSKDGHSFSSGSSCSSPSCQNNNRRADCDHVNCVYQNATGVEVEQTRDGAYALRFTTLSHIPFGRGSAGEKPSWFSVYKAIHDALTNPKDEQTFVPARVFAGCDPMRVFDPNHCSCLDWHVAESERKGCGPRGGFKWLLSDPDCGQWRDNAEEDEFPGAQWNETDPDTDRCVGARHGFNVKVGRREISIDFLQCADDGNMLVLQQVTTMVVEGPTDPAWEDLIDGHSIMRRCDTEMLGTTWCWLEDTAESHKCAVSMMKRTGSTLRELEWLQMNPGTSAYNEDRPSATRLALFKNAGAMPNPLRHNAQASPVPLGAPAENPTSPRAILL
ncbi:Cyclin-like F-box [Akanthomyces lecanii RCEF 1005]|uniref:Cyclin-like F-box n=1 Tax=Akanthomyces lecanii RCEF 1005 TaxID=1081108 RepID=A0A162IVW0_CORDF|nr:Cyclin-like F-box [Akanthomyces lecanii RCEF 1005]